MADQQDDGKDSTTGDQRTPRRLPRRDFLDLAVSGTVAATAAGIVIPSAVFVWPPEQAERRAGQRVKVAEPDEIKAGTGKAVMVDGKPVLLVNTGEKIVALKAACPHLGCVVKWNPSANNILCPCHGAAFDPRGNVLFGPSPAPLGSLDVTVTSDGIYVG